MSELQSILKGVSRSFYLSLFILPRSLRPTLSLAFLMCKAADTIADTEAVPAAERLQLLEVYRKKFLEPQQASPSLSLRKGFSSDAEHQLLQSIPQFFTELESLPEKDQREIHWLVPELTQGMILDLNHQPSRDEKDLERYTYYVAGIVGRFWTRILKNHFSFAYAWGKEVEDLGEEFGKGLQLVNILRDLPHDLQQGRFYLPNFRATRSFLQSYLEKTKKKLAAADLYVASLPRYALRLRAAVTLPQQLGFQTLKLLESSATWPHGQEVIKVSRRKVYQTLLLSLMR